MGIVDKTFGLINQGATGDIRSIPTNIPKLDTYLYGIRQGTYYLLGGDTGTGKSAFIRSTFIHNVHEQVLAANDPTILDAIFVDFSLEISAELNLASTITRKLYYDHQKVLPVSKVFGWSGKLSQEERTMIDGYKTYLEGLQRKLHVIDKETTPTLFHDTLLEVAKRYGRFASEGRSIDECGEWTPNNPNLHIIILFDTLNLAELDSGHTTVKSSIDRISKIAVRFRNKCGFIFVGVQQFNSDISTTDRSRFGVTSPILKDFMDSTGPTKDATVVLGLYSPMRYLKEEQVVWRGYDVSILRSWLVSLHILKNRYGEASKYVPLKFDGAAGVFSQLPEAKDMTPQDYVLATRHF